MTHTATLDVTFSGLQPGDRITHLDGSPLDRPHTVRGPRADGAIELVSVSGAGIEWALYRDTGAQQYTVQRQSRIHTAAPMAPEELRRLYYKPPKTPTGNLTARQREVLRDAYRAGGLVPPDTHGSAVNGLLCRGLIGPTSAEFRRGSRRYPHHRLTPAAVAWIERDPARRA